MNYVYIFACYATLKVAILMDKIVTQKVTAYLLLMVYMYW